MPALWACQGRAFVPRDRTAGNAFPRQLSTTSRASKCRKQGRKLRPKLAVSHLYAATAVASEQQLMQTVDVSLGDRSYPIYIGQGLLDDSDILQRHVLGKKVLVVTNETVAPLYLDRCCLRLLCQLACCFPLCGNMSTDRSTNTQVHKDADSWGKASGGSGQSARWRAVQEPGSPAASVGQGVTKQTG